MTVSHSSVLPEAQQEKEKQGSLSEKEKIEEVKVIEA